MQRHEMMTAMTELGLKGMAGAFDEAVTTGLQRNRTTMEVLTDLLRAEATHRHAASVRYRMSAARLPAVKDLDAFVFDPQASSLSLGLGVARVLGRRLDGGRVHQPADGP